MGGWIVALLLLSGVAFIGYKVGEPYLANVRKATAHAALDPRAEQFLTEGESALREGNLDLAREKLDKASALAESEPRVLLAVARLAAARADVPWLKTRLVPESDQDDLKAAKQDLADLGAAAKRAAEAALAAAPDDPGAVRAKIDALRIVGERDAARGYVAKVASTSGAPETAYVLAALDLAEIDPPWASVIDRLRVAAAGEGNSGRARSALIYALARSGDAAGAKSELERLPPRAPLLAALRAFIGRAGTAAKPANSPAASNSAVAAAASGTAPVSMDVDSLPKTAHASAGGGEEGAGGGDPREILRRAAGAENKGDFPRAKKLYEDVLGVDPNSSEALAGLGSVSLKEGDHATARSYFGKALAVNPNFVPALVGQADSMWAEGDRDKAQSRYKDIVDRFPESAGYPSYVKTRAEGSTSGSTSGATAAPTASSASTGQAAPAAKGGALTLPANTPSDLPGVTPP